MDTQQTKSSNVEVTSPALCTVKIIGVAIVALAGVGILGFLGGMALEENDGFCASCHTVPETTYVDRANAATLNTGAPVADLASSHFHLAVTKGNTTNCISCHRGSASLPDRSQAFLLGAKDTLTFVSGKADPTIEKTAIMQLALVNTACIGCHEQTLLTVRGNATHFHNWLPATQQLIAQGKQLITTFGRGRMRSGISTQLTCTDCHLAHKTVDATDPLAPKLKFVDKATTQKACDKCHADAGERPQTLQRLLNGEF